MTKVIMRANAEYDLVGTKEFDDFRQALLARYDVENQSRFRGEKLMKMPTQYVQAVNTNPLAVLSNNETSAGPESGFIYRIARVTISTSGSDGAGYKAATQATPSQPAVPASTVAIQNPNTYPVNVVITGGTVTAVFVNGIQVGSGDGTYIVPSAGSISVTYSVAPTWVWSNANTVSGTVFQSGGAVSLYSASDTATKQANLWDNTLQIGQAYYPSSRGGYLFPSEILLAVIQAPVVGNVYTLNGLFASVPAEMQGKLI